MGNLRIFRERTGELGDHADLRGLNDVQLFQKAGFFGRLAISGIQVTDARLESVAQRYNLSAVERRRDGLLILGKTNEAPGSHRIHALSLFFAALELHEAHPHARILVFEHHGIRQMLLERSLKATKSDLESDDALLLSRWKRSEDLVTLHAPVSLHLARAGVLEHHDAELRGLSQAVLSEIQRRFSAPMHGGQENTYAKAA